MKDHKSMNFSQYGNTAWCIVIPFSSKHSYFKSFKLLILNVVVLMYLSQVSLGTLVPNSRDWHDKNGDRILHTTKHTLKYALFEKSILKTLLTLLITLHCCKQSKNLISSICRGFSRFWNPAIIHLPACCKAH